MSSAPVSVVVVARDEEDRIERCLRSVQWAEERIVVIDTATVDRTAERARPLATELITLEWQGFAETKRRAFARARCDWILWIDADEEVSPPLAETLRAAVSHPGDRVAFRVRRRNHYLGRTIRHGGWRDDRVVRLFRGDRVRLDSRLVHERLHADGEVGDLDGLLEHRSYRDLAHHWRKIRSMAGLWAEQARRDGRRATAWDLILRPAARFLKGYILLGGFLDGPAGVVLAFMDAAYSGMKYACLMELELRERSDGASGEGR